MDSLGSSSSSDDKWKLSKKGRSRSGRPQNMLDAAAGSSSTAGGVLSRSYSASVSSTRTTTSAAAAQATATGSGSSSSCCSQHQTAAAARESSSSSSSRLPSRKMKCVEAVKEHRARFYIVRRCVSMLVCWRDY